MKFDTRTAADYAGQKLDSLLERATRDTTEVVGQANIPASSDLFCRIARHRQRSSQQNSLLQSHIDQTCRKNFANDVYQPNVKTIKVDDVGRVTVNVRWSCSMLDKETSLQWLRPTGTTG